MFMQLLGDAQEWTENLKWTDGKIPFSNFYRPRLRLEKPLDEFKLEDFYLYVLVLTFKGIFPECIVRMEIMVVKGVKI